MDKAIEYLEYLSKTGGKVGYDIVVDGEKISYNEVIAELIAHKAVLNELKEWASKTTKFALVSDDFSAGYSQGKTDILQKLEELTNV